MAEKVNLYDYLTVDQCNFRLQRKINADLKNELAMVKTEFADYRNQVETKHHVHETELRLLKERGSGPNVEIRTGNNYDRPDGPNINMIGMSSDQINELWEVINKYAYSKHSLLLI